ncbi:hypothetical protein [Pseudomonas sp. TH31]|uniref:hypothetical protein n=1 Tax=Pseudomonas sp. TH31 TaxID=2796396 RepID=UPI0019120C6A|nr:hypothetical protein [Pseudomonas sp. TH31]MBK5415016.1 hypothetical protein [Pseudomonas sp. TH31]
MASPTKQQKRSKRAKIKAKQQRVARSAHPSVQPDNPEGLGSTHWFEELFAQFLQAENQSRKALFVALFTSLTDLISLNHDLESELTESQDSSEATAVLSRCIVVDYRKWTHGATEAETYEWLSRPDVIEDFTQAKADVITELTASFSGDEE